MSFSLASAVRPLGDGTYTATLPAEWTVGPKPHGGFLLVILARAAVDGAARAMPGTEGLAPLAVSAQFLRAPEVGPVLLRTEVRKTGRTATVVAASLEQRGRCCVEASVTVGRMPSQEPHYADLPDVQAAPPADAVDLASLHSDGVYKLGAVCDVRLDPRGAGFLTGRVGDPLELRLWARPIGERPDPYFALLAGDLSMPVTMNLGRFGWSPTVQLTALLRADPAPGWLRMRVSASAVHGQWFDEDATVIDAAGRLVCQARQLALTPAARG
ncbi:thioesterase family protein [Saccharothrix coeruleofusca]|uniref:Aromatic compound degradation protein PaaI n=1 Tax=Saccharothrix coeruleofusca TaxID=33919 RepID=A0A918AQ43_9PSEU|nr:thioesterase family protein [Saccharothrix coeruleofusca]GGP57025.1 aromatic compound degradation protein PaaI [Saccharothrix coeruleofusca]